MAILFSFLIFVLFAAGLSLCGNEAVRPAQRSHGARGGHRHRASTTLRRVHPSLVFHDLVKRLGNLVPASPKDVTVMQRRLIRAGYRNPERAQDSVRRQGAFARPAAGDRRRRAAELHHADPSNKFAAMLAAVAVGFFGPNEYVRDGGQAPAEADPSRAGQCARPAGGLRRIADWVSIRPSCRWPRNWNTRIRRSAKSSAS